MKTAYIRLHKYWTRKRGPVDVIEIQVSDPEDPRDVGLTVITPRSLRTGDPIAGEMVLNLDQVRELRDALSTRILELDGETMASRNATPVRVDPDMPPGPMIDATQFIQRSPNIAEQEGRRTAEGGLGGVGW